MSIVVLSPRSVTGAATVRALLQRGASVRAATRDPATWSMVGATPVRFALEDRSTWEPALEGASALCLCLPASVDGLVSVSSDLLAAAAHAGVHRIVKLSAGYCRPGTVDREVEQLVEAGPFFWLHLRAAPLFEQVATAFGAATTGDLSMPAGDAKGTFIAASDVGLAAATALMSGMTGEAWTLTGPEALSLTEVAAALSTARGTTVAFHDVSEDEFKSSLRAAGVSERAVADACEATANLRAGRFAAPSPDLLDVTGVPAVRFAAWAARR
jgi:uncharacterized protein YbjT (DUF2867 family)